MEYIEQLAHGLSGRRYHHRRKPAHASAAGTGADSAPPAAPLILLPPYRELDDTRLHEDAELGRAVCEAFWHLRHFWP
jgi:hypothetical protein